jgi:hypothetical protein
MILLDAQMSMRRSHAKQTLHASLMRCAKSAVVTLGLHPASDYFTGACELPFHRLRTKVSLRNNLVVDRYALDEMFWRLLTLIVDWTERNVEWTDWTKFTHPTAVSAKGGGLVNVAGAAGKRKSVKKENLLDSFLAAEYKAGVLDTSTNQVEFVRRAVRPLNPKDKTPSRPAF